MFQRLAAYNVAPAQNMPSSCTDAFDYVSTLDHTLASAPGSFETAGHFEQIYWPLRDHETSNLIDLTAEAGLNLWQKDVAILIGESRRL
jgi:hypothetical protein